jgi:hypothetical protein
MDDIIDFLAVNQWLAVVRIGIGLWWLKSFLHKPLKRFVNGQMVGWTLALAENHPVPGFGRVIKGMVAPNAAWFPDYILMRQIT